MRIVAKKRGQPALSSADPCPACGVAQARHWRCARCTARGHLLGHTRHPDYCDDCINELIAAQAVRQPPAREVA